MDCQLSAFEGKVIEIGRGKPRQYTVLSVKCKDNIALATIKATRATYTAVRCNNTRVIGLPGAETWAVLGSGGRTVVTFAIHNGDVRELSN